MSIIRVLQSRILEAACRTDFMSFFQWAFHALEPGSTFKLNWHHYAIATYLELVRRGKIKPSDHRRAAADAEVTDGLGRVPGLRAWSPADDTNNRDQPQLRSAAQVQQRLSHTC